MKFSVSSSALLSLLATAGKVISNKSTLPILDYFCLVLKDGRLQVTTSDLETTMIGSIEVENVESEGSIAAPVKQMLDLLKEFPEMPLTISVDDSNWEITVNWKSGSLSFPGASAVSYPELPEFSNDKCEIALDVDTLVNGINKTIFATADDNFRPQMNGVYFNFEPGKLTFVATDAHKLVKYAVEREGDLTTAFILPKKPANLLKSALLKEDEEIRMSFDANNVRFELKNATFVCRLIEGSYPNYNAVIPTNNPNKVLVLQPHDEPDPHGHRPEPHQPHGAGHRLLAFGQRDHLVQLRRHAHHHRLQVDLPGGDPVEHRHPDRGDRAGRLDPCGRVQARLRRQAGVGDPDADHAHDD